VLASICFWIFGIQSPLIWGFITFIVSILPLVGPYLVYLPLGLFKMFEGFATQNPHATLNGVFIIIFGFVIISTVDNFLRYKITGARAKQHPLIVLIGVLGGFNLFGFVGLFFGPLILVFALVFMEVITKKDEIQDKKT
jgi:predicted PurR-regulated permease PerM